MCFGSSGGGTQKIPPPKPQSRFEYNRPVPENKQQQMAAANNQSTDPLGQTQLGSPPTNGGY